MSSWYTAILVTVGIVLFLRKAWHNYTRLPHVPYVSGLAVPEVTVIVPAQNEERNIARVIGGFAPEQVIVVDDGSTDRTAALAGEAAVRVLPAGGRGKAAACLAGAQEAKTEWILFADANTSYGRVFLPCLVEFAQESASESVSVFLRIESESLAGRMLLPYAMALYFTGVNARTVNARRPSQWLASGHCLLIKREIYLRLGGHPAAGDSPVPDAAFAKLTAERGPRTLVARAEHMGTVYPEDSFDALWTAFQRTWFPRLRMNPFSALQVAMASILLLCWLPVVLWLLVEHSYRQAVLMALLPSVILFPWYRSASALLAPAAIYLFQVMAVNSMITSLSGKQKAK